MAFPFQRQRRRAGIQYCAGLLACLSSSCLATAARDLAATSQQDFFTYMPTNAEIVIASEWLAAQGIHGLCHPNSHRYAPAFPHCQDLEQGKNTHFHNNNQRRHLEQEEGEEEDVDEEVDEEDRYAHYYDFIDDDNLDQDEDTTIIYADPPRTKWYYIFNATMAAFCVAMGALAAGLTVGLLSIDPLLLVIKTRAGETEQEKQQAEKLLPLVKQHHRLLVTLLLLNTIAGEALPVFLQGMVPGAVAVLVSVVLVLVFGEILPTALFTGPNQLQIASRLAPMVKILMWILYPVTFPIARVLDRCLMSDDEHENGDEEHAPTGTMYNRGELAALIRVQYEERLIAKQRRKHNRTSSLVNFMPDNFQEESDIDLPPNDFRTLKNGLNIRKTPSIDGNEVMIVEGALQLKTRTAKDILLSYHKVFCVPYDMTLDEANIFTIYASGHSRVPVYVDNDRRLVKGILMTRQLMVIKVPRDGEVHSHVSDLNLYVPQCVSPETDLGALLNLFQQGGCAVRAGHMALVCVRPEVANDALDRDMAVPEEAGLMGIITLEDVLEALIQEPIYDEKDVAGKLTQRSDEEEDVVFSEGCDVASSYKIMRER